MTGRPGRGWREFDLIAAVRRQWSRTGPGDRLGIGDDAAAHRPPARGWLELVTCDALLEGVHWDFAWCTPREVGRKAAAVNCSDIAAMGGVPQRAYVTLALPPRTGERRALDLMAGLAGELARHGARLAGGDTVASPGPWAVSVTLQGVVRERELLTRSGARPGDALLVTGHLGAAAAGLALARRPGVRTPARRAVQRRLLSPEPRLPEGRVLARSGRVHALLDLSDGLAGDLRRLCEASGVGARVHAARLPIAATTRLAARALRADPLDWALNGGEDYELLFALPLDRAARTAVEVTRRTGTPCTVIGVLTPPRRGLRLVRPSGREDAWPAGWEHRG
jgi:thiamine-monophosphate kinase